MTWDKVTDKRIKTLDPRIQGDVEDFINEVEMTLGIYLRVSQARRTKEEQDAFYAQGRTKPGKIITWVKGGKSWHNYGLAIDIVEIKNKKAIYNTNYVRIVPLAKKRGFEWGGDWPKKKRDKPHFQKTFGQKI